MSTNPKKCYSCLQLDHVEEHFPFCSKLCHEAWADKNYGKNTYKKLQDEQVSKDRYLKNKAEARKLQKGGGN